MPPGLRFGHTHEETQADFALAQRLQAEADSELAESLHALGERGMFQSSPADAVEGRQEMVLIACEIGELMLEMMVDTGAQSSVISSALVTRLGLWNKVNRSRRGVAAGVGRAEISGRLELVAVQMGHVEFQLNFSVLEIGNGEEMLLLGIDQLRRFKCILDLERNKLVFGGGGGVEVDLLQDQDRRGVREGRVCPQM